MIVKAIPFHRKSIKNFKKTFLSKCKRKKGLRDYEALICKHCKNQSLLNTFTQVTEDLIIKTIYKSKPTRTKSLGKQFVVEKGFFI